MFVTPHFLLTLSRRYAPEHSGALAGSLTGPIVVFEEGSMRLWCHCHHFVVVRAGRALARQRHRARLSFPLLACRRRRPRWPSACSPTPPCALIFPSSRSSAPSSTLDVLVRVHLSFFLFFSAGAVASECAPRFSFFPSLSLSSHLLPRGHGGERGPLL